MDWFNYPNFCFLLFLFLAWLLPPELTNNARQGIGYDYWHGYGVQLSHRQCVFCYSCTNEWGPSFSVLRMPGVLCFLFSVFCTCTCNFLDSPLVVLVCVPCTPTEYSVRTESEMGSLRWCRCRSFFQVRSAMASRLRVRVRYGVRISAWHWQSMANQHD